MSENSVELLLFKSEKDITIYKLREELKVKDLQIKKLSIDLKQTQNELFSAKEVVKSLENRNKTQFTSHLKSLEELKSHLLRNDNKKVNQKSLKSENNTLIINNISQVIKSKRSKTKINNKINNKIKVNLNTNYAKPEPEVEDIVCEPIIYFDENPQNLNVIKKEKHSLGFNSNENSFISINENSFKTIKYENRFKSIQELEVNVEKMISNSNNTHNRQSNIQIKPLFSYKLFKCQFNDCNKSFITLNALKLHNNSVHKRFKAIDGCFVNINEGINSQTDYKPFKCVYEECGYSCVTSTQLKRHINCVHNRKKLFECDFINCGQKFGRKEHLKRHMNSVHNKVKPFECHFENCGKKFTTKPNLRHHINRHLGYKPFKCDFQDCNYSSVKLYHLKRHISSVHNKEKPFVCDFVNCGQRYGRKEHLNNHIKQVHTNIPNIA